MFVKISDVFTCFYISKTIIMISDFLATLTILKTFIKISVVLSAITIPKYVIKSSIGTYIYITQLLRPFLQQACSRTHSLLKIYKFSAMGAVLIYQYLRVTKDIFMLTRNFCTLCTYRNSKRFAEIISYRFTDINRRP